MGEQVERKKGVDVLRQYVLCQDDKQGISRDEFHQLCFREICFTAAVNNFSIKSSRTLNIPVR